MAEFDARPLADIGDNLAYKPATDTAKAYTLASLIDQQQLGREELATKKSERADLAKVKNVLASSDLSTYEGKMKAGEQITKISPKLGMDFQKQTQEGRSTDTQYTAQQYELMQAKNEIVGGSVLELKNQHDALASQGKSEPEINAAMMPHMISTIKNLMGQKLPDGTPVLNDQDKQNLQQMFGNGYNPASVDTLVARSKQAREALKSKLDERKTDVAEAKEGETERHNRATEERESQKVRDKEEADKGGALSDDAKQLAVDRLLSGEKSSSVLSNLGRGAQGARDLRAIQNKLAETAKARGITGPQLVKIMQSTAADGRAVLELGAREGKIAARVQEAQNFAEIAKAASAAVPRGNFVPWNKLKQMGSRAGSDPKLAKLYAATNSLVNAYAAAVGGGTPTVHDKEAAEHMLATASGPEAYDAVVDQLILETQKALDAPGQVRERMTGIPAQPGNPQSNVGATPSAPGAPGPGGAPPSAGTGAPGAGPSGGGQIVDWASLK